MELAFARKLFQAVISAPKFEKMLFDYLFSCPGESNMWILGAELGD